MSTDTGIVIPGPFAPMTRTPLPSVETAYTAIIPILQASEQYGNNGNVYRDPVSGLDIGYGIQLIGPNGKGGALTPNATNIKYVLEAMGVAQADLASATTAVVNVLSSFSNSTDISDAATTIESALTAEINT